VLADYAALVARCTSPDGTVRPDAEQNLALIPELIVESQLKPGSPYAAGASRATIVLGVDAVAWHVAEEALQPDLLWPLTSVVPSTSVAAWVTAVSGLNLPEHRVPGPVYRHAELPEGRVWNIFRDRHYGFGDDWTTGGTPVSGLSLGPWPTVFGRLAAAGVRTRAHLGDIATMPGSWSDALVEGASAVIEPELDWPRLRMDVPAIVRATIDEVDASLRAVRGEPALIWIHVNIDEYIHHHGYDAAVVAACRRLGSAAEAWADAGACVLLHSDHGQIRTACPPRLAETWRRIEDPAYCVGPAGGAGRIRWLHCKPGKAAEVRAILEDTDSDGLLVRFRDEVPAFNGVAPESVGEVVVIGAGRDFPVPDLKYVFEHGGMTADEMVAPLAIWRPRAVG
jgi:hypothetical protein